jgi:ubiquinone/menaquinone biosynthesis C-methylase UbiE
MNGHGQHHHHDDRHEHGGFSSIGMFNDREVLLKIGLKQGQTFLDAGCADGHFSFEASELVGEKGKVIAVDKHRPSLEKMLSSPKMKRSKNIQVMEHDLTKPLKIHDTPIDHFFMSNVLHGFTFNDEVSVVIENIKTSIRSGGRLSIIEWDKTNVVNGPPEDHRISYQEVLDLVGPHGFTPIERSNITDEHVLLVFRAP